MFLFITIPCDIPKSRVDADYVRIVIFGYSRICRFYKLVINSGCENITDQNRIFPVSRGASRIVCRIAAAAKFTNFGKIGSVGLIRAV